MALRLPVATRNTMVNAARTLADGGSVEVRTGPQPASADAEATGTLLVTFTLPSPAFQPAVNGAAQLAGTPIVATAVADGTAGWFRVKTAGGATVMDGVCGTQGAELNLSTTSFVTGVDVSITGGPGLTMPAA